MKLGLSPLNGKAEVLPEGDDAVIWALGPMVHEALELSDRLKIKILDWRR